MSTKVNLPTTEVEPYPTEKDFERVETQLARINLDMSACAEEIEKFHLQGQMHEVVYQSAKLVLKQIELIRVMDDLEKLRLHKVQKDISEIMKALKALAISVAR